MSVWWSEHNAAVSIDSIFIAINFSSIEKLAETIGGPSVDNKNVRCCTNGKMEKHFYCPQNSNNEQKNQSIYVVETVAVIMVESFRSVHNHSSRAIMKNEWETIG